MLAPSTKLGDDPEHEFAPIVERQLDYYDFTLKMADGSSLNLREFMRGKRLVVINYSAGWCKNSNYNGPVIKRLYDKYKEQGLGVIAVMEYSSLEEVQTHINRIGIDYPVVIESQSRDDRERTQHFKYRSAAGDKRKWGTPFYVIIDTRELIPPVPELPLAARVHTVSGEIIETEAEKFIEQRLK